MSTRTQFYLSIGITAALMVVTLMMPETADAFFRRRRTPKAPEIDPGTISNAIALAMGGLAVLSDKLRRR